MAYMERYNDNFVSFFVDELLSRGLVKFFNTNMIGGYKELLPLISNGKWTWNWTQISKFNSVVSGFLTELMVIEDDGHFVMLVMFKYE